MDGQRKEGGGDEEGRALWFQQTVCNQTTSSTEQSAKSCDAAVD